MWSHFGSFWSVKYLSFEQKLPIRIGHYAFLERDILRLKIHVMFCPPRGAKKGISSWTSNVENLIHDFGSKLPETLNISISNFCKLRSWTLKEASFARSSSNVELWSWHTILKSFSWIRFIWPIIFHCETSKQLEHKKIEMLQKQ